MTHYMTQTSFITDDFSTDKLSMSSTSFRLANMITLNPGVHLVRGSFHLSTDRMLSITVATFPRGFYMISIGQADRLFLLPEMPVELISQTAQYEYGRVGYPVGARDIDPLPVPSAETNTLPGGVALYNQRYPYLRWRAMISGLEYFAQQISTGSTGAGVTEFACRGAICGIYTPSFANVISYAGDALDAQNMRVLPISCMRTYQPASCGVQFDRKASVAALAAPTTAQYFSASSHTFTSPLYGVKVTRTGSSSGTSGAPPYTFLFIGTAVIGADGVMTPAVDSAKFFFALPWLGNPAIRPSMEYSLRFPDALLRAQNVTTVIVGDYSDSYTTNATWGATDVSVCGYTDPADFGDAADYRSTY